MATWKRRLLGLVLVLVAAAGDVRAAEPTPEMLSRLFPGADRFAATSDGPPAFTAYINGSAAGFVLSTGRVVKSTGYGGGAIDILVGVERSGRITGAELLTHNEPILVIGVSDADFRRFISDFKGRNVLAPALTKARGGAGRPDKIAGASVSSAVIEDAIVRAARTVLRAHAASSKSGLIRRPFTPLGWEALLAEEAVQHRRVVFADVAGQAAMTGAADGLFIDLYTALLTPPRIGGNLLGERDHQQLFSSLAAGDNAVMIAGNGYYSFKGRAFVRTGVFDRIQIVQDDKTIPLTRSAYQNIERLKAEGAPELREAARFVIPAATGFDPVLPWRVDLFVPAGTGPDGPQTVLAFDYRLPDEYRTAPSPGGADAPERVPLWQSTWQDRQATVAGVIVLLAVLTAILVFQDQLARHRRFRDLGRIGFLTVVLVWLGWYAGGQLSVLQVVTFAHAFLTGFQWEHFLVDPVIFILWGFVAVTLLLWGRGVYCGWLCPFGALQELVNTAARRLNVRQIQVPFAVHERLWAIKYVLFIALFAISLHSIREAIVVAEIEPFKTAISLKFVRSWPFVVYVGVLIGVGLFIERFFCRYLCPLGAALAIPARLRTFNWLKRRHQCGSECQICSERCTVQAIHPTGEINPNECIHCLECQTYFFDDHICPPLVAQRKRRERRQALAAGTNVQEEIQGNA